jgi:hypothetical protein
LFVIFAEGGSRGHKNDFLELAAPDSKRAFFLFMPEDYVFYGFSHSQHSFIM